MSLTDASFDWASKELGCDEAAIRAVAEVESPGMGILPCGIPVILFEAHVFSKYTGHKYDKSHPKISSPRWNRKLYAYSKDPIERGRMEAQRLELAASLDRKAALMSCSWGRFQIMGYNWKECGFSGLQAFVNAMYKSEDEHLKAFVNYIKSRKLDKYIRAKDWDGFAAKYNGPGYKQNRYDEKLAAAYKKHGGT